MFAVLTAPLTPRSDSGVTIFRERGFDLREQWQWVKKMGIGELGALSSFGGGIAPARISPETAVPAVAPIEPGQHSHGASPQMDSGQRGADTGVRDRHRADNPAETGAQRAERPDPNVLTGPSPAFQASVLELEQDLQNVIARLEAARGKRESDTAMGPVPDRQVDTKTGEPGRGAVKAIDDAQHRAEAAERPDPPQAQSKATVAEPQPAEPPQLPQEARLGVPPQAALPGESD